jgi:hypothetical protein
MLKSAGFLRISLFLRRIITRKASRLPANAGGRGIDGEQGDLG